MPESRAVEITWLGHSTFKLRGPAGELLLVDPFVASNPACPAQMRRIDRLDVIAVTHGHADHVGDAVAVFEQAEPMGVVAIVEVAHWLRRQGIPGEHVIEMNKGGTVRVADIEITMVDARHSTGIADGDRLLYGGEAAGLVFRFSDGTCVYHAGDTCVFSDMALIGELYRPDIVMLPIGDHYTMGPRQAAMACELVGAPRVVPMHFGTFPVLTGTPEAFRQQCVERGLDVEVVMLRPGETFA